MISIFMIGFLTYSKRQHKVIKATNYRISIVALIGLFFMSSSVIPFGYTLIDGNDKYSNMQNTALIVVSELEVSLVSSHHSDKLLTFIILK